MITEKDAEKLYVQYLKEGYDDIMDFRTYVYFKTGLHYNG